MKILIIDGYNILGRNIKNSFKEEDRESLISKVKALTSGLNFYTYLIFDGSGKTSSREIRQGIEILFSSQNDSADELIVNLVKKKSNADVQIFVVTADRDLSSKCIEHGAKVFKNIPEAVGKKKKTFKKDDKINPSESLDFWKKLFKI